MTDWQTTDWQTSVQANDPAIPALQLLVSFADTEPAFHHFQIPVGPPRREEKPRTSVGHPPHRQTTLVPRPSVSCDIFLPRLLHTQTCAGHPRYPRWTLPWDSQQWLQPRKSA
ncbi:hypothetical protein SAMD00023353_0600140 [Rosellinia necatrix]|uniref:Uncharacterized protein n=1 Tax=Rosellinia necatrix TaxID=77044 RepID=A0A1S8A5M4_ROSNE|nr:hypothetical protein SAMD00023353_0600140 [Rosellinia necatrix]